MTPADPVRARVTDGPWGPLLGALARRGFSGEVAVLVAAQRYAVHLRRGAVIGASSPLSLDSIVRIALTGHLITPTHVAALGRVLASAADRDEIEVVTEVMRLTSDQARALRTRAITQRAARTFAVEEGEVEIRAAATAANPWAAGVGQPEVAMGAVIFQGAQRNLSEQRLGAELRALGTRFALAPGAEVHVPAFGLGGDGDAVVARLRGAGATLPEIAQACPDVDPRTAAATLYALVSTGAARATGAAATLRAPGAPRAETPRPRTPAIPAPNRPAPAPARAPTGPIVPRTMTPRWAPVPIAELEQIVTERLAILGQGADYFAALGLVFDAPIAVVHAAHAALVRALAPEDLAARGTPALQAAAARLREHVDAARTVLTDPARRCAYVAALRRGGDPDAHLPRTRTEEERSPVDEAVYRAQLAMRANQPARAVSELTRAVELAPDEPDHAVMLAWARFCAAPDQRAAAGETRRRLAASARMAERPALALFYLGRVERMLGREREALLHLRAALELDPANLEAAAEIRVLEARLARASQR